MTFSETDLILSGNRIYHLDVTAEDLADIILTVGDPDRVALVTRHFQSIERKHHHRGFVLHTGYYNQQRISVLGTGMGTQNMDIVLNELDALVNIDFNKRIVKDPVKRLKIIRLGTTAALQESIALNSLIVSEQAIDLTGAMLFYQHAMSSRDREMLMALSSHLGDAFPAIPLSMFQADSSLVDLFTAGSECTKGITMTCPGFYAAQGRQLRAPIQYSDYLDQVSTFRYQQQSISNLEMETAAIYGLGGLLGHQCCSLNVVLLNRISRQLAPSIEQSQQHLIEFTLDAISRIQ